MFSKTLDISGLLPVHRAAHAGDVAETLRLVEEQGDVDVAAGPVGDDKLLSREGATPLHFAALGGHGELVAKLLEIGASSGARTARGESPLHYGTGVGVVVRLLVEAGCNVDAVDAFGGTPLLQAARHDHVEGASQLLEQGANVDLGDARGMTPLMTAAVRGCEPMVTLLIGHGASVELVDELGKDAAAWARYKGQERVATLIREGAPDGVV